MDENGNGPPMIHKITVNASPLPSAASCSSSGIGPTTIFPTSNPSPTLPHPPPPIQPIPLRPESLLPNSVPSIPPTNPPSAQMPISNRAGPRLIHSRPPLRFDRAFLEDRSNQLKLIQMFCGLFSLVLTVHCWPNRWAPYCVGYLWDFWQLFNAVCVHGFFLVGTTMLALAHLLSVPDAFYHYNFPLLEKFYTALALGMYLLASFFAIYNLTSASFLLLWLFPVGAILAAMVAYFVDFWTRFRRDREELAKTQGGGQATTPSMSHANPQHRPYIT